MIITTNKLEGSKEEENVRLQHSHNLKMNIRDIYKKQKNKK